MHFPMDFPLYSVVQKGGRDRENAWIVKENRKCVAATLESTLQAAIARVVCEHVFTVWWWWQSFSILCKYWKFYFIYYALKLKSIFSISVAFGLSSSGFDSFIRWCGRFLIICVKIICTIWNRCAKARMSSWIQCIVCETTLATTKQSAIHSVCRCHTQKVNRYFEFSVKLHFGW